MRECIFIHNGQAGIEIGNSTRVFCLEHGIQPDGTVSAANEVTSENCSGTLVPDAVIVRLESAVVGEARIGH